EALHQGADIGDGPVLRRHGKRPPFRLGGRTVVVAVPLIELVVAAPTPEDTHGYPPLRNKRTPWRRTFGVRRAAGLGTFNVTTSRPPQLRSYHRSGRGSHFARTRRRLPP